MSILGISRHMNVARRIDRTMRTQMKSRFRDSEDADVLVFKSARQIAGNGARSRMWFKRQFFALRMHVNA